MATRIPMLGVPRRSMHCIFKSSAPTSTTHLNSTKIYRPKLESHNSTTATVYDHAHEAGAYGHSHTPYRAKPLSKWGYRVSPLPVLSSYNRTQLAPRSFINNFIRRYSTHHERKVAVVLSGSGVLDGTEIHEAVSVLVHLSRAGVETKMFAPDKEADVVNHITTTSGGSTRRVLEESARIARGKVKSLNQLETESFSAIIFPGGYGAAKNLCTFATQGENFEIDPQVERVLKEFHAAKKPIGMLCVSPVIIAKIIPGARVTVGNEDKELMEKLKSWGADAVPGGVNDVVIDEQNNIVTSPAYMINAPIHKVFDGIGNFVDTLLGRTTEPKSQTQTEKKA